MESIVASVLASVDNDVAVEDVPSLSPTRFQAYLIQSAKAEFGPLRRLESNRLMVRRFMRDLARERKVRPSHIQAHLDAAVAIYFIPSDGEIVAHQVGASREAHVRAWQLSDVWESFFGVYGRMKGFSSE